MQDYVTGEKDPLLDPLIKSYYQANLNLARTIAVKSSRSAEVQNKVLLDQYGISAVNEIDPASWKYYLNLAGEYHPTDTPMVVTSLDTLQPIDFTKANLALHPNTAIEYRFGTRYYQTLVSLHPTQEDLIMGILMPCNIFDAIEADDGTILRYATELVEENEYSLLKELEEAIKNHQARWYVDSYRIIDNNYLMAYYAVLYSFILPKLLNLRDAKRNTYEAHSFHVRMFLRGYMGIDQYYQFLTQEQAMYLYRNLPRLIKSMGYNSQFEELMEKLLTPRDIQLLGYTIRQTNQIGEDLSPTVVARSELLNRTLTSAAVETLEPEQLIAKEVTVLYGTKDFYDAQLPKVKQQLRRMNESRAVTKNVVTRTQPSSTLFSLSIDDFALNHWAYMSANALYTAPVIFENPRTGTQQTLTARQGFIYFYYLSLSYVTNSMAAEAVVSMSPDALAQMVELQAVLQKHAVTRVPPFLAQRHTSSVGLGTADLLELVDDAHRPAMLPIAEALLDNFNEMTVTNTAALFYTFCLAQYKNYVKQHGIVNSLTDPLLRGYARNMVYKLYEDTLVTLGSTTVPMSSFLASNNLDSYETVGDLLPKLLGNLYEAGTGLSAETASSQQNITRAMIAIMRSLTSYNIQYIDASNSIELTSVQAEPVMIHGVHRDSGASLPQNQDRLAVGVIVQDSTITQL